VIGRAIQAGKRSGEKDEERVNLEKTNLEMSHYSSQLILVFLDLGAIGGTTVPFHSSSDEHFNGFKNSVGVMTSTGI